MTAISTAKRRRRQAAMNNAHLAKIGRRMYLYGNASAEKRARKLAAQLQKMKDIAMRKGQSKR